MSCNSPVVITREDQQEIFSNIKRLNNLFIPENKNFIFNFYSNRWEYFNKSYTEFPDSLFKLNREEKSNSLINLQILSDELEKEILSRQEKFASCNFAMLLTNGIYGDVLYQLIPTKGDVGRTIGAEDGDGVLEEYMKMTDEQFDEYLMSQIFVTEDNSVVYKVRYDEISVASSSDKPDRGQLACYLFLEKDKEKGWLLDDIIVDSFYKYEKPQN